MSASDAADWLAAAAFQLKLADAALRTERTEVARERIAAAREYARLAAIDKGLPGGDS